MKQNRPKNLEASDKNPKRADNIKQYRYGGKQTNDYQSEDPRQRDGVSSSAKRKVQDGCKLGVSYIVCNTLIISIGCKIVR